MQGHDDPAQTAKANIGQCLATNLQACVWSRTQGKTQAQCSMALPHLLKATAEAPAEDEACTACCNFWSKCSGDTWLSLGANHVLGAAVRAILRLSAHCNFTGSLGAQHVIVGKQRHLQNTWLPLATDHLLCAAVPPILRPLQLAQAAQAPHPAHITCAHWLPADCCSLVAAHQQDYIAAAWHGSRLHASSCLKWGPQHRWAARLTYIHTC